MRIIQFINFSFRLLMLTIGILDAQDGSNAIFRRTGIHDGNLVYTRFSNFGNLGSRYEPPKMEWPKGSGTWYGYEFIMMAGAEVTDTSGNIIHIISENYTNASSFDISPDETHTYGWEPLPGYFNTGSNNKDEYPAMSHKSETWPDSWPHDYPGLAGSRDGLWNGEFGAYTRADQESYYVMDDRYNDEFGYYPFINSSIDSTGFPLGRRGLGLQVGVRGYQWVQVQAEDILIVRYDIKNVSNKILEDVVFGMYVDPAVGGQGDSVDDDAEFDTDEDITYCWDLDGIDNQGRPGVGYFGYAFLESPGNPLNGYDDDQDGLIDERQDNDRGELIFGPIGNFGESKLHWSGDEDGDWRAFEDKNSNDLWDEGEEVWDDTGSDGISPDQEGYPGPDLDGTEANGLPDHGEPNFGKTDNDESDQIGLTSFLLRPAGNSSDDERTWNEMTPSVFAGALPTNLAFTYGSGYFSMPINSTRKFAITCLFGNDFDDIIRNKKTMQKIYDADYSFAKPPRLPVVTAVSQNKRVVLKWDSNAERSIDPIYGRDFEGYLVYRATDPSFNTIKTITDSYGNPIFWEPIAQFDIKNGLNGPHPIPVGETGAHFNIGNDTGLQYYFVDENVENGRTYYYAVCSYDKGYDTDFFNRGLSDKNQLSIISPSECEKNIQTNLLGEVVSMGRNCATVVPNAPSAGYTPGAIGNVDHSGLATGIVNVNVLNPDDLKENKIYHITFTDTTVSKLTKSISIKNITDNDIVYESEDYDENYLKMRTFEGLHFDLVNDTFPAPKYYAWKWGNGMETIEAYVELDNAPRARAIPEDFEIRVLEFGADTAYNPLAFLRAPVNFQVWNTTINEKFKFSLNERVNIDSVLNGGDEIVILFDVQGFNYKSCWKITMDTLLTAEPSPGDIFKLIISKPFGSSDTYEFKTTSTYSSNDVAKSNMDNIYVVPDPYVVTASWEKPLYYSSGRGERRIDFVNLPRECTIKIFSMSGKHIKTINRQSIVQNGAQSWDLITDDGLTVSYGVYIYHVEAPGIGMKIGKFALIK